MNNTSDPVLAQAEADLKRAEEQVERAIKERDELVAFIRRHKMYTPAQTQRRAAPKPGKDETLVEALEAVLGGSDGPMFVHEIVAALKVRGKKMNTDDPARLVSSIMSRNPRFSYERESGWSLA